MVFPSNSLQKDSTSKLLFMVRSHQCPCFAQGFLCDNLYPPTHCEAVARRGVLRALSLFLFLFSVTIALSLFLFLFSSPAWNFERATAPPLPPLPPPSLHRVIFAFCFCLLSLSFPFRRFPFHLCQRCHCGGDLA